MNKFGLFAVAGLSLAAAVSTPALAATFAPVAVPDGGIDGAIIGINDKGEVTGSYVTDPVGPEIGFVGSIDGNYETFVAQGAPTFPRGVNNQGLIVGFYVPDGGFPTQFVRNKNGSIDNITKDGNPLQFIVQGVNASGEFAGEYLVSESPFVRSGYTGKNAEWQADITLPFPAVRVAARAINAKGDIVGFFVANPGEAAQGFLMKKNGDTTVLNYPEPNFGTFIQGINDKGEISGQWFDTNGGSHSFALDSDLVTWTLIDPPGAVFTQAFQINNLGQIAVNSFDGTSGAMYIYCPKKGGVCTGDPKKEKPAAGKKVKGKALKKPAQVGNGVDPDAKPKHNGHRM